MVERICPKCQHGNPVDNRFCGHCGAPMDRSQPAPNQQTGIILADNPELQTRLKQVGQAVAVGLATLVAEAGIAWLRRRIEQVVQPSPMHVVQTPVAYPVVQAHQPTMHVVQAQQPSAMQVAAYPQRSGAVTVTSQRVLQTWEQGTLTRQTVERHIWRREQE